jgi:hypothetical protein
MVFKEENSFNIVDKKSNSFSTGVFFKVILVTSSISPGLREVLLMIFLLIKAEANS